MDHLQKAQSNGVVLGLKAVAGVVPRLDIDELLLQEPDAFNLFVLAFSELKSDNKIMGYFQIAGASRCRNLCSYILSDLQYRNPWSSKGNLEQYRIPYRNFEKPQSSNRLLRTRSNHFPNLAPAILGYD
jgi:hypothetical protein